MKVVQVNSVSGYGSTGRIVIDISETLDAHNFENYIIYGRKDSDYKNSIRLGSNYNVLSHLIKSRVLGKHGFYSKKATEDLVEKLEEIDPDIIHLHNVHGYYLNVEILFNYLAKANKQVVWTLHDCWSFTGHCAYYDYVDCSKWQTKCHSCPQLKEYPKSMFFDRSEESFIDKKQLFNSVENITFVTPSKWLKDELGLSYLKNYPATVINNGIDLTSFKPSKGNFRASHSLEDKFIILGVASVWERRKGLPYFFELSEMLAEDEVIVLVGLTSKQIEQLPINIIGIERTSSLKELVEIYSTADVFVNPTLEDNFPTTNIEAIACGTPVVTFDTGGSPEIINQKTGLTVTKGDSTGLYKAIKTIKQNTKASYTKACVERASSKYSKDFAFDQYVLLYKQLLAVDEGDIKVDE